MPIHLLIPIQIHKFIHRFPISGGALDFEFSFEKIIVEFGSAIAAGTVDIDRLFVEHEIVGGILVRPESFD